MSDQNDKNLLEIEDSDDVVGAAESDVLKFEFSAASASSSGDLLTIDDSEPDILSLNQSTFVEPEADESGAKLSEEDLAKHDPVFRALAKPTLPDLAKRNRARIQMQSPTRLYLYWSIKNNPFHTLRKIFGGKTGTYVLIAKLINRTKNTEQLFPIEPEGNWWFEVDSDSEYIAEIGFYAPNRPFIRIMYSNSVRTPRKSPSRRLDYTPSFKVDAYKFAEVLDAAGYQRDAFEVAIAGDDEILAEEATQKAYSHISGKNFPKILGSDSEQLRLALLALASGYSLNDIRGEINASLFELIQSDLKNVDSENVLGALKKHFDVFTDEYSEEETGASVFGASVVNFPKRIRKKRVPKTLVPKLSKIGKPESISSIVLGLPK